MSELDKTIEELEQEVLADLNEAEMKKDSSAAGKGAVAAEPMKKMDSEDEDAEDLGAPVVKGDEKKADAAKKVKQDASIKSSQKGDQKADSVKEGYTDDEIRALCHSKDHDCATVVEHPIWGLGKPIEKSHAIPDDNGFVEWYDVQFKHGIEEKVMAEDVKILKNSSHNKEEKEPEKMTKMELKAAMDKKLMKMGKHDLVATYKAMEGGHEPTEEQLELDGLAKAKEAIEKRLASISVKEDVDALVEGEDLSEEFKQ